MKDKKTEHLTTFSELEKEWNDEKDFYTMYPSGSYVAKWKCLKGHEFTCPVGERKRKRYPKRCPYCFGRKVQVGVNDLATTHPHLIERWADERKITEFKSTSGHKATWRCEKGHLYQYRINAVLRSARRGCPYCSRSKALPFVSDLATLHPHLISEWADERDIRTVGEGSHYKALWECSSRHQWRAIVSNRVKGYGCPYCSGRLAIVGKNDFSTVFPHLVSEWDDERSILEVSQRSNYSAKWRCSFGHKYKAMVNNRAAGRGCPYCSGVKVLIGFNDLRTTHPHLEKEWDDERAFVSLSRGSEYRARWKCSEGHNWISAVHARARLEPTGCPKCWEKISASKPEEEVSLFVKSIIPEESQVVRNTRKLIPPFEVDIFLPEQKIGIEFNGTYWHSNEFMIKNRGLTSFEYHSKKLDLAREKGVVLLFVWEKDWADKKYQVKEALREALAGRVDKDLLGVLEFS